MPLNPNGSNREQFDSLDPQVREDLLKAHVLVGDPRRWRPRWFDGRFLAASDLLAEQNYFLVRQADLGRAAGSGVVEGLDVALVTQGGDNSAQLRIAPGHGITDTGELVTVFDELQVNPADVPEMRRLDGAFGLQVIPNEPGQTRTGLYVLGLRPVEWTAAPIGAYPTSLTGQRVAEDGTIVEGVAVALIPYPDGGNEETWELRRSRVAREIFVEGRDRGLNSGVLPLAMVALRGNLVEWLDPWLVRRETGAERPAGMDFGFGQRALREAHLLQYEQHLTDSLSAAPDQTFAAAARFAALPPVGRLPAGAINADRLTQRFFPAGIEVDLSFLPEDELPALIEESLLLPPLDLTLSTENLVGTGVVVLVPLARADFVANRARLPDWNAQPPRLRPGFVTLKAAATPRELLVSQITRADLLAAVVPANEEEPWRNLLRGALQRPLLWYVRRRHLPIPSNAAATPVSATSERLASPSRLIATINRDPAIGSAISLLRETNLPETAALTRRLAATTVVDNPALLRSLLTRATGTGEKPTAESVIAALTPASDPELGTGLKLLGKEDAALATRLGENAVADTGLLSDVDKLARDVPVAKRADFTNELTAALGAGGAAAPVKLADSLTKLRKIFVGGGV